MSSIASMMTNMGLPPGVFQGGLSASHMPAGLERAATNALSKGLSGFSTDDARSYTSQLIIEQYSLQITASVQTFSSSGLASSTFSSSTLGDPLTLEAPGGMPSMTPISAAPSDFSAEGTAQVIFSFSISLFAVYQSQNPDDSVEAALADFEQIVRDAIDEGFGEARSIIEDLGSLDEQIEDFIDQTYAILDRLLEKFFTAAAGGELEQAQQAGAPSETYWESFEIEYRYLSYEALSITQDSTGEAGGAGSYSIDYARLQFESLSVSMSYGQAEQGSTLEYLA